MPAPTRIKVGDISLTRVLYTDALVPADRVGLTSEQVAAVSWNDERWSSDDGQVRVGAAAWVISQGDEHFVVDPFMAADDIFHDPSSASFHRDAITAAFEAAAIPVERITGIVQSHIEGIGMVAVQSADSDDWSPMFPNARVHVSAESLAAFREDPGDQRTAGAWTSLLAADIVDTYADGSSLLAGVTAQLTGAHNVGHNVFHVGAGQSAVTFVGHLAVSPLHLATGICPGQHPEPERALEQLLGLAADGRTLIGPLWPSPGAGQYIDGTFFARIDGQS